MVTSSSLTLTIGDEIAKMQTSPEHHPFKQVHHIREQEYAYVLLAAWKLLKGRPYDARWDEAYELTQKAFYKYCRVIAKATVTYPRTYLRKTLGSLRIDETRQPHKLLSLQTDEHGELITGTVINSSGAEDPAEVVYQKLVCNSWLEKAVPDILALPFGQFHALVCHLKEKVEDLPELIKAFKRYGVEIEDIEWPTDEKARQSSRSLLCHAQKKMRLLKPSYASLF